MLQELGWRAFVEPPFAFFEEQMEACFGDAVVSGQMPLCLVPEVFDAVDVDLAGLNELL